LLPIDQAQLVVRAIENDGSKEIRVGSARLDETLDILEKFVALLGLPGITFHMSPHSRWFFGTP
jgi:hypothetical protein